MRDGVLGVVLPREQGSGVQIAVGEAVQDRQPLGAQVAQPLDGRGALAGPGDLRAVAGRQAPHVVQGHAPPPADVPAHPADGGDGHRVGLGVRPVRHPGAVGRPAHRPAQRRGLPEEVSGLQPLQVVLEQGPGQLELPARQFRTGNAHRPTLRKRPGVPGQSRPVDVPQRPLGVAARRKVRGRLEPENGQA